MLSSFTLRFHFLRGYLQSGDLTAVREVTLYLHPAWEPRASSFRVLPCKMYKAIVLERGTLFFFNFHLSIASGVFASMNGYFLHGSVSWDLLRNHFIFYLPKTVRYYFFQAYMLSSLKFPWISIYNSDFTTTYFSTVRNKLVFY